MIRCFIGGYRASQLNLNVGTVMKDSGGNPANERGYFVDIPMNYSDTSAGFNASVEAAISAQCILDGISAPDSFVWMFGSSNSVPVKTYNVATRSLDTAFQISSTQAAEVYYTVKAACTLSLTGGQEASFTLKYADDSGFTTNVVTLGSLDNGNTGALTIGLNTVQTVQGVLAGAIPAGKYVKIVSANVTGTPTKTLVSAQEVLG